MAYNIKHLDSVSLQKKLYFFDANLWLKILKPSFNLSHKDKKYLDFFQKFRRNQNNPRIAVTALLLSEVINRYIREVTYPIFCQKAGQTNPDKSYYKQVYRQSPQYKIDYVSLCEDINSYSNIYELISDGLGIDILSEHVLTSAPVSLDFNDHYYLMLAKKHGLSIITDDGDFFIEDVEVLTYNNQLIERVKNTVVPKQ